MKDRDNWVAPPDLLRRFKSLRKLNLGNTRHYYHDFENENRNQIYGTFPSLAECANLLEVDVNGNHFDNMPELWRNGDTLLTLG